MSECKHKGLRRSLTYPIDSKTLKQEKLVWCDECGALIKRIEWKVPLLEDNTLDQHLTTDKP